MKALTITQPWATLIAVGAKRIETRSWSTKYRGPLAIHAAKGFPKEARAFTVQRACCEPMGMLSYKIRGRWFPVYPQGAIVATCTLIDCVEMRSVSNEEDGLPVIVFGKYTHLVSERPYERALGGYEAGRFAWILSGAEPLEFPIPAKGSLGLWEWDLPRGDK